MASVFQDRDPFMEDPDVDQHIGTVKVWLQSMAYNIEIKEQLEITDYKGAQVRTRHYPSQFSLTNLIHTKKWKCLQDQKISLEDIETCLEDIVRCLEDEMDVLKTETWHVHKTDGRFQDIKLKT